MKQKNAIKKLSKKRLYLKILHRIFRLHNFHFKCIHLILRIYNKKDSLLDININTNSFIINSLRQDIESLTKQLKADDKTR